ncbi:MAG: MlaD family protein [Rhodoferax sp.]
MENRSHAIASGVFVLLALALLTALVVWLTRDTTVRRDYDILSRDAVIGLQPQANVRFKGVPVGRVTAIDLAEGGQVRIRIAVDERVPMSSATYATLGFQGVTGLSYIQLDEDASVVPPQPLPAGEGEVPRLPLRTNLVARLSEQGAAILGQLEQTAQRVNALLAPAHQQTLLRSVQQVGEAAASIAQLAQRTQGVLEPTQSTLNQELPRLVQEGSASLAALRQASERLGASADAVRASADEYRRVAERLGERGGALEQLQHSAQALQHTTRTLQSAVLPRLGRGVEEGTRAARQVGGAAQALGEQPQSLLWGKPAAAPGPGEPGFTAPTAAQGTP